MDRRKEDRDTAAAAAADQALRAAVSMAVQLALVIGVSLAVEHRQGLAARGRRLLAALRRDSAPPDQELQEAEFARAVADYSRGGAP